MTELRVEPFVLPAADLGPENPLPVFRGENDDDQVTLDPNVPEEDRKYMGWRTAMRMLPYCRQDGYNRERRPRAFKSIVLENEQIKATFVPEVGGKLWSLYQKSAGRELLQRNPVFQPANLALRDAWTSGGVEWNAGQLGHHYLTCSPLFAAEVAGDGYPVLRMYEWDRVKGFVYQLDFHLPPGSPMLYVRVRIVNPHDYEIAMYWWTNIAVDEAPDVRVLVPANSALHNAKTGIAYTELPKASDGRDITYSTNNQNAAEFFARIPAERRKWIAALDGDGRGLVHASTDRLGGRKLFCWGMGPGGRRWQEFLSEPGQAYIEIQAGLARTQLESLPMPANSEWSWTEAFGLLQTDPALAHGDDWQAAIQAAEESLERMLPRAELEHLDAAFAEVMSRAPEHMLMNGAGWGALERLRRGAQDEPYRIPAGVAFDDASLGDEQAPWMSLLNGQGLPEPTADTGPGALMVQDEWLRILEDELRKGQSDHWAAWYHLGNMYMEARRTDAAKQAWLTSVDRARNGWALRNMAVLEQRAGHDAEAADLLMEAWEAGPRIAALAVECAAALNKTQQAERLQQFLDALPEELRKHERLWLIWARSQLQQGHYQEVAEIFDHHFATIREGEETLSDMWFRYQELRIAEVEGVPVDEALRARVREEFPPPRHIDFRMATEK